MQYTINKLISDVKEYLSVFTDEDERKIRRAYEYAKDAHENFAVDKQGELTGKPQLRFSGEPYITHPLGASFILVELRVDVDSIVSCLLHDVIEDTAKTEEDIKSVFGDKISTLSAHLAKLSGVRLSTDKSQEGRQIENLKKMFLAMAEDMRVVFIKLADRLHNMRTIRYVEPEKQRRIARETLEIYAPLADRLGIFLVKPELEDLCFKVLYPVEYEKLIEEMGANIKSNERYIKMVADRMKEIMKNEDIHGTVKYRVKHYYSIYKKMEQKHKSLDEIVDLIGLRVVVKDVPDCYRLLGVIHHHFPPMLGHIKDYIATPKVNGYQSLHTTVFPFKGEMRKPTEIQIRTISMNDVAEIGAAAHFKYSEKKQAVKNKEANDDMNNNHNWVKNLAETQNGLSSQQDFLQSLKLDFFSDRIFVATPYGDIKDLPKGSTPIDFAYLVHTDLGNKCRMAKVNSKAVSLHHKLQNGDTVDITTSQDGTPKYEWLSFVKTSAAKTKIRQHLRAQDYEKNHARGLEILNHELRKLDKKELSSTDVKRQNKVLDKLPYKTFDDVLVAVGEGTEKPLSIMHKMYDDVAILSSGVKAKGRKMSDKNKNKVEILVGGLEGLKINLCNHCFPVLGDKIVGFVTHSQGIKIHKEGCRYIQKSEKDRLVQAQFRTDEFNKFEIKTLLECENRVGLLRDIADLFSEMKLHILDIDSKRSGVDADMVDIVFKFDVENVSQLEEIFEELGKIRSVRRVRKI